ncbi:hypothetical protein [Marinomonas polaris]|uniref:hypothetical protein n=2 Tax=Marinomonas polaris TaxID=293552 RepID=UPI0009351D77|nr:hypothetical protein [Marinomonas polaris]
MNTAWSFVDEKVSFLTYLHQGKPVAEEWAKFRFSDFLNGTAASFFRSLDSRIKRIDFEELRLMTVFFLTFRIDCGRERGMVIRRHKSKFSDLFTSGKAYG